MEMTQLALTIGGIPLFVSRVFATTFVATLIARFQPGVFIEFPPWAVSDEALVCLGILAFVEIAATKSLELQEFLGRFDPIIKGGANLFYSKVVLSGGTIAVAALSTSHSEQMHQAGFDLATALIAGSALGVFVLAKLRTRVLQAIADLDDDDSLGLRGLLSWAEDGWVLFGVVVLVFFPLISLILAGLAMLSLVLVERFFAAREKRARRACPACDAPNHPSALSCRLCRADLPNPQRVGIFGQPIEETAFDLDLQRLELAGRRRCMVCAAKLSGRSARQKCSACGTEVFPSREWAEHYLAYLNEKLWKTMGVCAVFSLFPFLGLIPGVIYYRLHLLSSVRAYIPLTNGCITKVVVRLVNAFLLAFQWVPLLGAAMIPLMCYVNYEIYRRSLVREAEHRFGDARVLSPATT